MMSLVKYLTSSAWLNRAGVHVPLRTQILRSLEILDGRWTFLYKKWNLYWNLDKTLLYRLTFENRVSVWFLEHRVSVFSSISSGTLSCVEMFRVMVRMQDRSDVNGCIKVFEINSEELRFINKVCEQLLPTSSAVLTLKLNLASFKVNELKIWKSRTSLAASKCSWNWELANLGA